MASGPSQGSQPKISSYRTSAPFLAYLLLATRPKSFSIWPQNENHQFVIQQGEHFCCYGANGRICNNARHFSEAGKLWRHVCKEHAAAMVVRLRRPSSQFEHQQVIDYYAMLMQGVGGAPVSEAVAVAASPVLDLGMHIVAEKNKAVDNGEVVKDVQADVEIEEEDEDEDTLENIQRTLHDLFTYPYTKATANGYSSRTLASMTDRAQNGGPPTRLG